MTWWMILLIIVSALWLISLLRLGGRVKYGDSGATVILVAGPARVQILPKRNKQTAKGKEKKPLKKKTGSADESGADEEKKPGTLGRLLKLLPVVAEAAGALLHKIRIDRLDLSVVWGASDAASAAIGYGRAQAVIGIIWPLLDNNFKIKQSEFYVDLDYAEDKPQVNIDAAITITIGQVLVFAVHYGIKLLLNWSRSGRASANR